MIIPLIRALVLWMIFLFGSSHDYAFDYQAAKSHKLHTLRVRIHEKLFQFQSEHFLFFILFFDRYRVYILRGAEWASEKKWREKAFISGTSNQALWLDEALLILIMCVTEKLFHWNLFFFVLNIFFVWLLRISLNLALELNIYEFPWKMS
jgi:hypothetical protein